MDFQKDYVDFLVSCHLEAPAGFLANNSLNQNFREQTHDELKHVAVGV